MLGLHDRGENRETRKLSIGGGWAEVLGQAKQRWLCTVNTNMTAVELCE